MNKGVAIGRAPVIWPSEHLGLLVMLESVALPLGDTPKKILLKYQNLP